MLVCHSVSRIPQKTTGWMKKKRFAFFLRQRGRCRIFILFFLKGLLAICTLYKLVLLSYVKYNVKSKYTRNVRGVDVGEWLNAQDLGFFTSLKSTNLHFPLAVKTTSAKNLILTLSTCNNVFVLCIMTHIKSEKHHDSQHHG